MASTYVNDLRLNEMATGDQSGSWGTVTNTNLELIAEAFSFGTEAITTNANTHTTTIADGGTDPGRSMFLKYTGTLDSACTITIGPNTVSKLWFIENATSGSQNIIIKQGSGATITIPPGDTKAIYSDGAGSGGKMVDAFASLSVVDLKVQDDLTVTDDASVGGDLLVSGEVQTANIGFTDGDNAMVIADGGAVTFPIASVFTSGFASNADSTMGTDKKIEFRDAAIYLNSSADGQLDIVADTEIQIAATTVDINGAVALNGAVTGATNITLSGELDAATGDFSGIVDVAGVHTVSNTTDATATTDGALIVSGGVGIAKKLFVGDNIAMFDGVATFKNLDEAPLVLISGTDGDKELIDFQRNGGASSGSLTYHQSPLGFSMGTDSGHTFRLKAGGTDRLTVQPTSGNNVVIADGLTLTDGNLIVAAGHGIDFSAGGGSGSNLLDEYEEGTWTPIFGATDMVGGSGSGETLIAYAQQTGFFTRIGNTVYIQGNIRTNGRSGTERATLTVDGLPFAVNGTCHGAITVSFAFNFATVAPLSAIAQKSETHLLLYTNATGNTNLNTSNIVGSGLSYLTFEGFYTV